jgi:hypothetical protein
VAASAIVLAALGVAMPLDPAPPMVASPAREPAARRARSVPERAVLDTHLLVTWYGNPWNGRMGILGRLAGRDLAAGLKEQTDAYASVTDKTLLPAYHLIAVVAQGQPGADGRYRRRESRTVIERMLREAREAGFKVVLDVQTGRSTVLDELAYLGSYLAQPDVYLALDPEFAMPEGETPGRRIGQMRGSEVNDAIAVLDGLIRLHHLPPKVLIVHQFTLAMLPDKEVIADSPLVDLVLDMDGFGSPALKRHAYRMIMRQRPLEYAGVKLFYLQDTDLLAPADVLRLSPAPSVVIYQ